MLPRGAICAGEALASVAIHKPKRVTIMAKAGRGGRMDDVGLNRIIDQANMMNREQDY